MKITYYHRRKSIGYYSLENSFNNLRKFIGDVYEYRVFTSKFHSNGIFKRLYNILEAFKNQSDINHVTGDVHYLTYLLRKKRTVLTILDCVYEYNTNGIKKILIKFFWYYIPIKKVKIIHVISHSSKKELLKSVKCDENKIRVIPVLISPIFRPHFKNFNNICPRILQIGTGKNKNLSRVIKALGNITCVLEIIGILDDRQINLLNKYKINYVNSFNLSDDEVLVKYQNCDIVIFVSEYEGFGMPILEANAVGRVVITSNIYSMPEISGNSAHLVNPLCVDDIKNGILKLIADKVYRDMLVSNGFENLKRYDQDKIVNEYKLMYEEVLNK